MKEKLVYGFGINDLDEPTNIDGMHCQFYTTWSGILRRCYSNRNIEIQPTYSDCRICEEWKYLSNFKKWFDENYVDGFALDKDILIDGNKIYSPDTCRFVPQYLNNLLIARDACRGDLPIGVCEQKPNIASGKIKSSYQGRCMNGYGKKLTKTFKTVEEASAWYVETKKRIVKEQATRAFLDNSIKSDVYLALIRRNF